MFGIQRTTKDYLLVLCTILAAAKGDPFYGAFSTTTQSTPLDRVNTGYIGGALGALDAWFDIICPVGYTPGGDYLLQMDFTGGVTVYNGTHFEDLFIEFARGTFSTDYPPSSPRTLTLFATQTVFPSDSTFYPGALCLEVIYELVDVGVQYCPDGVTRATVVYFQYKFGVVDYSAFPQQCYFGDGFELLGNDLILSWTPLLPSVSGGVGFFNFMTSFGPAKSKDENVTRVGYLKDMSPEDVQAAESLRGMAAPTLTRASVSRGPYGLGTQSQMQHELEEQVQVTRLADSLVNALEEFGRKKSVYATFPKVDL